MRTLHPELNQEPQSDKKRAKVAVRQDAQSNLIIGGGKDFMEERRLLARNRRINTILDYEQNKPS